MNLENLDVVTKTKLLSEIKSYFDKQPSNEAKAEYTLSKLLYISVVAQLNAAKTIKWTKISWFLMGIMSGLIINSALLILILAFFG